MQDSFDITTLIFIVLAIFVIWRLRSVLGQKTGSEQPPFDPLSRRDAPLRPGNAASETDHNVVRLPGPNGARPAAESQTAERWKGFAEPGTPTAAALDSIARAEPGFDPSDFLEGAKSAYEMIVTAFAVGDRKTLKDLLSREVYEGFERAITEREQRGERVETTFVSIDKAEMAGAEVHGRTAQVIVRFVSQLITVTRDASGTVVDGSPDQVAEVTDVWTFARQLGSRDPNWQLVATEAGQ
ncbi:Tim44/TimA family putative adaptor protein [Microvirga makkahensis]|uniref:Tim44/TimA family putative adaptor protein n=1 Tax=Microvirga makkahensis TaxID=1128670 RepID=A0A7X3SP32_9HYPH|nr:Tim44/TimA family putative adaptor protein [Microvirga makkahensis]MXQ11840.1 Tim44/TimA family putative adaptor protein [Microvirga makkahensis]